MSEEPLNRMEGRARRRASPAGIRARPARVEPEPPPTKRYEIGTARMAVVYYLCRNQHLEHPHFMEVSLASPQGLYLRDVMSRLDALRGKGMAAKYSWSCKRRYKNGFVWHDLSEGDLLLPAQGTEYVLKGSELQLDQSTPVSDHQQDSSANNAKVQLPKPAQQQESPRSTGTNQGWPSTCTSPAPTTEPAVPVVKEEAVPLSSPRVAVVSATKKTVPPPALLSPPSASTIGYDEQCRMPHSGSSNDSSPKASMPSSGASSPGLNNQAAAHDAATQTDDKARRDSTQHQQGQDTAGVTPENPEIVCESHSKRRAAAEQPSGRRSGTLQSLIRAEAAGRRRGLLEEDERTATISVSGRLKPANLLMCLMTCGPHNPGSGLVRTSNKQRFTRLEYPSSSPELYPLGELKPGTTSAFTAGGSETENSASNRLDSASGKLKPSSSRGHQDGVCEEAHPSANPSRSASNNTFKAVSFHDENEKGVKMEERQ
ncbi:protein SOSEKI 3-like [Lolium rigidum]|uniref:protein SOSEKI 3-like n=1 Tax=Lolium rigidum TaxID=89674 RepID=UPI001F5D49BF|nr:protein SOSEKI 3-like [Lolium rigidum]